MANKHIPDPLDPAALAELRAMLADRGERSTAATLGVSRATLARAAGGLGIRAATAAVIRAGLGLPPAPRPATGGL